MGFDDELFPESGLAIRRKYNEKGKLETVTSYRIEQIDEKDLTKVKDEIDLVKALEQGYKR